MLATCPSCSWSQLSWKSRASAPNRPRIVRSDPRKSHIHRSPWTSASGERRLSENSGRSPLPGYCRLPLRASCRQSHQAVSEIVRRLPQRCLSLLEPAPSGGAFVAVALASAEKSTSFVSGPHAAPTAINRPPTTKSTSTVYSKGIKVAKPA